MPSTNPKDNVGSVLVTGATGFIGRHLVAALLATNRGVGALVRASRATDIERLWPERGVMFVPGDLFDHLSLRGTCSGFNTVFHLAGYVHAEDAEEIHADEMHWRITVEGTRALLREAVQAGVNKFVFVSSVKAMGEGGEVELDETYPPEPANGYGRAKLAAERLVLAAGREHGIHACVVRLPLVYGHDNKGNLARMIAAIERGRFPPLRDIENRRSMVHVDDVVQALLLAVEQPVAAGQVYIATDGHTYSTSEIELLIRRALGKPQPPWRVPTTVLRTVALLGDLVGKLSKRPMPISTSILEKVLGSAWYSSSKIRNELGFQPRRSLMDSIPEMVEESGLRRSSGE